MDSQTIISIIITIVFIITFSVYLAWNIKKKGLKEVAINMIIKAEEIYEKGQNREKMKYVTTKVRMNLESSKIGKILSIFITEDNIEKFIQNIFNILKKALNYEPKKEEI